jgi:hypothetical protein
MHQKPHKGMVSYMMHYKVCLEFYSLLQEKWICNDEALVALKEPKLAHSMDLVSDIERNGHVITMDNSPSNIGLFKELASNGIYVIRTMKSN